MQTVIPWRGPCVLLRMATDKHFNEPGTMAEGLNDPKPNDMPATINMFVVLGIAAGLGLLTTVVLWWFYW